MKGRKRRKGKRVEGERMREEREERLLKRLER